MEKKTETEWTKRFLLVDSGFDEYPGDSLRIKAKYKLTTIGLHYFDKHFMADMGIESEEDDEIEITVRLISRMETKRIEV